LKKTLTYLDFATIINQTCKIAHNSAKKGSQQTMKEMRENRAYGTVPDDGFKCICIANQHDTPSMLTAQEYHIDA
jgi:hypothetical protein